VPGAWNATYDLWFHTTDEINRSPDGAELMVWLDHSGGVNPGGKVVARNVRLAGAVWDVWYADSAWNYIAYVRTERTSSVRNFDLRAFISDAVDRGYIEPAWYLSGVEAGFEIWREGTGLASRSFSVSVTRGTPVRPSATPTATPTATPIATSSPIGPLPPSRRARPGSPSAYPTGRPPCTARWSVSAWNTGLVASVQLVNHGRPLSGWEVSWSFTGDERVQNGWGAEVTQSGRRVVARNAPYNGELGRGTSTSFGFQAGHGGAPQRPSEIRLNGARCLIE
jgi:hypothetical protein